MSSTVVTDVRRQSGVVVESVVRRFGDRTVLDRLDLTIADGELVILLGPSGCGKSTLLRLLAGLDRPDGGRVEVPAKRAIVFQADRLLNSVDAGIERFWARPQLGSGQPRLRPVKPVGRDFVGQDV